MTTTITLAPTDDTLVRDCHACLTAIGNGIGYPPFTFGCNTPTPLEGILVMELVHAHLARHIGYQAEHIEVDKGVKLLFHGAETLGDVSSDKWAEFTLRVKTLRQLCAPRI